MGSVGIIGGIGPDSTVDYYRLIIEEYRRRVSADSLPSIVINSIDMHRMLGYFGRGESDSAVEYLSAEIERLARAGVDFGLLSANTPHLVFSELQRRSRIPLVSIVEAAGEACVAAGWTRVGLLGTRFTMEGTFYPQVFGARGIVVFAPGPDQIAAIHDAYVNELLCGRFLPGTRERIVGFIHEMTHEHGLHGVIMAGTELPLLLRGAACEAPLLDTTEVHVRAVVERLVKL